ncbi:MAG TPA: GGDEF domain-containing protein, partial [Alphaproteobacteria bacterium]
IKKCLRTFDDAYRSDDGEFIMSLKQSDMRGGTTAVLRMRSLLQEEPVGARKKDGRVHRVTMSYCVGEPIPGDKMDEFISNMRADLKRYDEHDEAALEFVEQSPLLRFIKTGEE